MIKMTFCLKIALVLTKLRRIEVGQTRILGINTTTGAKAYLLQKRPIDVACKMVCVLAKS